jgi:hypothetical protein
MPEENHDQGEFAIGGWADTGLMVLIIALILWILRRQSAITDGIGKKMDAFNGRIGEVNTAIVEYKESWDTRKLGILKGFDSVCHERQASCAGLVDSKLDNIDTQFGHVCRKFEDMKRDREKKWEKQGHLNDHLSGISGLGKPGR